MDDPQLHWHLDEVSLDSFMSNYAPMPEHLRRRRRVGGGASVEGVVVVDELEPGDDMSDGPGRVGSDIDLIADSDPEDNVPLAKRKAMSTVGSSPASAKRTRRHLVKRSQDVGSNNESVPVPDAGALDIPVSIYVVLNWMYLTFVCV